MKQQTNFHKQTNFHRDMNRVLVDGQVVRHKVCLGKYDKEDSIIDTVYNAMENKLVWIEKTVVIKFSSPSHLAKTHREMFSYLTDRENITANGWAECKTLINDKYVALSVLDTDIPQFEIKQKAVKKEKAVVEERGVVDVMVYARFFKVLMELLQNKRFQQKSNKTVIVITRKKEKGCLL